MIQRKGIACDDYSTWFHVDCLNMRSAVYNPLTNKSADWKCATCGLPNFSSTVFNTTLADNTAALNYSLNTTDSSDPRSPVLTSSPSSKHKSQITLCPSPTTDQPPKLECKQGIPVGTCRQCRPKCVCRI